MAARRYYYSDSITDFLSRNTNEIEESRDGSLIR